MDLNNAQQKSQLLLHSCCAPCSSSVLERLLHDFSVTLLYYNPNIYPMTEYIRRFEEQKNYISKVYGDCITVMEIPYEPDVFYECVRGLENIQEGGLRCFACYELRLRKTATVAQEVKAAYFTTTLSVSPHKNATKLNEIGKRLGDEYGLIYYESDFKKKDGYKRSLELSAQYELYRQHYCGCVFSIS